MGLRGVVKLELAADESEARCDTAFTRQYLLASSLHSSVELAAKGDGRVDVEIRIKLQSARYLPHATSERPDPEEGTGKYFGEEIEG